MAAKYPSLKEYWLWIIPALTGAVGAGKLFIFSVLHNATQETAELNFLDRVSGYDIQSLNQRAVLFRNDLLCLFFCTEPVGTPLFIYSFMILARCPGTDLMCDFIYGTNSFKDLLFSVGIILRSEETNMVLVIYRTRKHRRIDSGVRRS